jgi:hypothetical protein
VIRLLLRCLLLTTAFALTTFGLMQWQAEAFDTSGIWPFAPHWRLHPLHCIALGIVMIPLSLWEIFLLEPRETTDDAH